MNNNAERISMEAITLSKRHSRTLRIGRVLLIFGVSVASMGAPNATASSEENSALEKPHRVATEGTWTPLFNGVNLDNWDRVIGRQGPLRLNEDPDRIFQVHDGMVHMYKDSADKSEVQYGYILTKKSYSHYHLRFEFKWGTKKFKPRLDMPRDAGVLYHIAGDKVVWPRSLELQVEEKGVGDFLTVYGTQAKTTVDPESIDKQRVGNARFREPAQGGVPFVSGGPKVYWVYRHPDAEQEGWNTVELIVHGAESAIHKVNGQVVNRVTDLRQLGADGKSWIPLVEGKILFQAEAAEVFYRNIEIMEL